MLYSANSILYPITLKRVLRPKTGLAFFGVLGYYMNMVVMESEMNTEKFLETILMLGRVRAPERSDVYAYAAGYLISFLRDLEASDKYVAERIAESLQYAERQLEEVK